MHGVLGIDIMTGEACCWAVGKNAGCPDLEEPTRLGWLITSQDTQLPFMTKLNAG